MDLPLTRRERAARVALLPTWAARPFEASAWLVLGAVLVLVLATFRDYGVAWDEQGETVYGALLLKYYGSFFHDHSAYQFVNFRFYGGGFELPSAILSRLLPFGEYETRHLLSALLGVLGLFATWRLGASVGGERVGLLSLLLLVVNPTWYGHMFINARDVPFASGIACCLLSTSRAIDELPRVRFRTAVLFGLALGMTMSVRVGGVVALVFLSVSLALFVAARARAGAEPRVLARDAGKIAVSLLPALVVAYAVLGALWPWAVESPLNPVRALLMFSRFPFDGMNLFDGRLVPAQGLPAAYLPVLLAVKLPEVVLAGIAFAVAAFAVALLRRPRALLDATGIRLATVAFAAAFPIVYFVVLRPVDYNGMRHYMFVVPPLTVLAAVGVDRVFSALPSRPLQAALGIALVPLAVGPLRALYALHPDQYVYFNALVGGPRGAHGRYELDYWGTSLADATRALVEQLERRGELPHHGHTPLKVYVCGNVWSAAVFFPDGLVATSRIGDADFQIAIDQFYCSHPPQSRRVLGVTREGALLSYVDDLRETHTAERVAVPELPPGHDDLAGIPTTETAWQRPGPSTGVPED
ncbi:MAG TPA: glycosyltransferase family 39 protein [Polyangiaceae bacterium]|nr:glycosyltransferase family 39 protein [Polyangiaceae bacterium]